MSSGSTAPASFFGGLGVGWRVFGQTWRPWVGYQLLLAVPIVAAIIVVGLFLGESYVSTSGPTVGWTPRLLAANAALNLVVTLAGLAQLSLAREQVRTGIIEGSALWRPFGQAGSWGVAIVVAVVMTLLDLGLTGLSSVFSALAVWAMLRAVAGERAEESLRAGVSAYGSRGWARLGFTVVVAIVAVSGVLLCLVGALATVPIAALAVAWVDVVEHEKPAPGMVR